MIERLADYLHFRLIFHWLEFALDPPVTSISTSATLLSIPARVPSRSPVYCNTSSPALPFNTSYTHIRCPQTAMPSLAVVEAFFYKIREVFHGSGHAALDGDRVADNVDADLYEINAESKYHSPHEVDLFHATIGR